MGNIPRIIPLLSSVAHTQGMQTILIAEDEPVQRTLLRNLLERKLHYACLEAGNGAEALYQLKQDTHHRIAAVLLDLEMPQMDGRTTLPKLLEVRPGLPVLVLTASDRVQDAVEMMRLGAVEFLTKPADPERLRVSLENTLKISHLSGEVARLERTNDNRTAFADIIGHDKTLATAIKLARKAARSDITTLITGETGTGKEVFARAIHGESARTGRPFVAVNCGAIPRELVESTLFGHKKGAFTGAIADAPGKFREADGGTLFLDEVGELSPDAQVKLLRALQQREVEPVGEARAIPVNVRVIAATHRGLTHEVGNGAFREDLYYRLNVFPIHLPPLRERRDDIVELAEYFLSHYAALEKRGSMKLSKEAAGWLERHRWPGNVRELENRLYRAVLMSDGNLVGVEAFDAPAWNASSQEESAPTLPFHRPDGSLLTLAEIEQAAFTAALTHTGGNITRAAEALGIGKSTLYRRLEK